MISNVLATEVMAWNLSELVHVSVRAERTNEGLEGPPPESNLASLEGESRVRIDFRDSHGFILVGLPHTDP